METAKAPPAPSTDLPAANDPVVESAGLTPSVGDPAAGTALLPSFYTDPALLEAEQELIFERTWQLAGHISALPSPGSYMTARVGSQPVLVVRDEHHRLRAYRNVCRHRASRLLSGSGQCKGAIRCRYHGWTYRFDGSLIGVPEGLMFGKRVDKSALSLMPARVEELCGLVFVNLDEEAPALAELVGDLPRRLAPYRIPSLRTFGGGTGDQPANWKVVVENYIEGYHIPIAHPGLMRMLDYKHYDVEVYENHVWFDAPLRRKPSSNRLERLYAQLVEPMPGLGEEDQRVWRYAFIYPNTAIDLYPDQVNTWQLMPDGTGRTHDVWGAFRPAASSVRTRAVQWMNQRLNTLVLKEDIDLVGNVQQGLETRGYECGPLSRREAAVAWFADRVRAELADAPRTP
ncbi:MAG: aromatic ring-hydroxylating dioxygenase subunit alpha [Actinomycetota bacterium]|nr:aromatic ring-hydroxylating dioxygenase subunit alpha [Actinomycetota bacterium]